MSFSHPASSNRLTSVSQSGATRSLSFDAAGNLMRDQRSASSTDCHRYDAFGRLADFARYAANVNCDSPSVGVQSRGQYRNNGLNQRSYKLANGVETRFVHGPSGELLFERGAGGDKTYVWLAGQPIALVHNGALMQVYNDHLGRPEAVTNASGTTVWRATNRPFERSVTVNSIASLNLGYPGQYFDAESGLWNNWHRVYDSGVGRYTQSDPIGLQGGPNTYTYVGGEPLRRVDPTGLVSLEIGGFTGVGPIPGPGGTITFGRNPNGSGFLTLKLGMGWGGGWSIDPLGQQPGYRPCQCSSWTGTLGFFGEAALHAGVAVLGGSFDIGEGKNICGKNEFAELNPKAEFSGVGMQLQVAGGVKASLGGGGSAKGACSC